MENNFKTIKDSVTRIIFESHNTGDIKLTSVWKEFLNEVKVSPILKTLYIVYDNIERNKFTDKDTAEIFLNENLLSFGSFSKNEIIKENNKVKDIIKEHISENTNDYLYDLILESTKDRKLSNLGKKAELFNIVAASLVQEKEQINEEEINENFNIEPAVIDRAVEILNEKYSFFNDTERGILKAFLNKNEESKKEYYESLIKENIKLIKRKLIENDNEDQEIHELLILTESKLKTMEYNSDITIGEFSRLIDFQKD